MGALKLPAIDPADVKEKVKVLKVMIQVKAMMEVKAVIQVLKVKELVRVKQVKQETEKVLAVELI